MKNKSWIAAGIMIFITLICLIMLVVIPMQKESQVRNYYVNHIYFLLQDAAKELETGEPAAASVDLQKCLIALEVKCSDAAMASGGKAFSYGKSFTFLAYDIQREAYQKAELEQMAADLREMIQKLSDKTGINPRPNVSYKKLAELLDGFLLKWVRTKPLWP